MITNGFTYIAVLIFIAAMLVWLQRYTKSKFFDYAPPIVLLYLITMILCTLNVWDMAATKPAYSALKNNLLYAMIFLLGLALVISAFGQDIGATLNSAMPFLDKATWTVLLITLSGLIGAVTPVGRMAGSTELSNLLLYSVVALLASRASFLELTDAPAWILAGFMILAIHGIVLVLLAKIFHLDMFTCGVASLANIGGSASAPILAGAYSGALVPVGVLMALMGYVIGTAGGLITANIMSLLA